MDADRQADAERGKLLGIFAAESEENLSALDQALAVLARDPASSDALAAAFRAVHTLKGNASIVGFAGVGDLAHRVEDALQHHRAGRPLAAEGLVGVLGQAAVALRQVVDCALYTGAPVPQGCAHCLAALLAAETAPAPAEARTVGEPAHAPERTLRVPVQRLDGLLDLTGELALAQADLRHALEDGATLSPREPLARLARLHARLQEQVMGARLVPLGASFRRQAATLRELAAAHGKLVRLAIEGGDVEVDTALGERLFEPLTHLLRNAVDHGVETPDARRALGKDPCGRVALRARHEGGSVVIEVDDDGAGLDLAALRRRARELGRADADELDDAQVCELVFEAGVSTARTVTELSGRGVGLDAVRRSVEALRGSVSVHTRFGAGTTFTLRLPLSLAIIEGFGLGVGVESYVVPVDNVLECVDMPPELAGRRDATGVLDVRGTPLPFVRLRALFGIDGPPPRREQVVVLRDGDGRAGLAVDRLLGASQTVVKPLGGLLRDVPGIAGTAILGAGRVALTLDPARLLHEAHTRVPRGVARALGGEDEEECHG